MQMQVAKLVSRAQYIDTLSWLMQYLNIVILAVCLML